MKRFLPLLALPLLFAACGKEKCEYDECATVAPAAEIQSVQSYLSANGLVATQHCSGIFYNFTQNGSGNKANGCDEVVLRYEGKLTNGFVFDSSAKTTPTSFQLGGVVTGFRNGMMQMRPNAKMRLYIPPSLGYGSRAQGPIPANSILVFDIELLEVR